MTKPTPAELIEAHERRLSDVTVEEIEEAPEGETSLQLLQTVYRDRKQPLNVRVRCAIEALPFENPKVSAVAISHMSDKNFAAALDRAIQRSRSPLALNAPAALPASEQLPPSVASRPMSRFRRY